KKVVYMTRESNCWLTFILNSIFALAWINKSEALRKQKESDEQHKAEKRLKLLPMHSAVDIAFFDVSICVWLIMFCQHQQKALAPHCDS
ncbi:TPR repeat-containing domain protein, partial [Trichinella spiralis]|uniref:TPR repeat-containing domain protein n=1 Tax=Trichinella spiralis TaxID=6334 RepID=UPI0001EFEDF3